MGYHISDYGRRLEAQADELVQAVDALRIAGSQQVGHETLNEIGQAINRVGCVLHNISSTTPQLDTGDIETIGLAIGKMEHAIARSSDNYRILVDRAVTHG